MQMLMTVFAVTIGMAFSLAIAILTEELIFGKVLAPLFAHQAVQTKAEQIYRHN